MKENKIRKKVKDSNSTKVKGKWANKYHKTFQRCHRGTKHVFDSGLLSIYGGGYTRGVYVPIRGRWLVITTIECDIGTISTNYESKFIDKWANLPVIEILIQDGCVPELPRQFWDALVKELLWMANGEELNVLVMCEGGHGRTGIVLSILANLLLREEKPVEFVRENYCHLAVETLPQERYIVEITDTDMPLSRHSGHRLREKTVSLDDEEEERQKEFLDELVKDAHGESAAIIIDEDKLKGNRNE